MISIATIINFCTNDFRLLEACVAGVRPFSQRILLSVCDHFFDGTEESYALIEEAFRLCPDCLCIEYPFYREQSYRAFTPHFPDHPYWRHEWANTGRWIAYYFVPADVDYILFLDVDEIVDAKRFMHWLDNTDLAVYAAVRLSAHWYFREAKYRATSCDDISLLVAKKTLHPEYIWSVDERMGIFDALSRSNPGKIARDVKGLDNAPLVDHYSWVRTKDELQKKFSSWSHHSERPWQELLENEYARPFQGQDFIRRYTYTEVAPRFDPLAVRIPDLPAISLEQHRVNLTRFPHVVRVDREMMQKKALLDLIENDRSIL
jgi:hypothetical protein